MGFHYLTVPSPKSMEISEEHRWVAWPAAQRKARTVVLVLVILILSSMVAMVGGDWLWGLTGGRAPLFFPQPLVPANDISGE